MATAAAIEAAVERLNVSRRARRGALTLEQATKHKRFCFYCLVAAAASFATMPQVLPEARLAWRALRRS